MNKIIYFTEKGYQKKAEEYKQLLASRPAAVADLAKAREMGDLSENGYYKAARMQLSDIDRHLRQLKYILKIGKIKQPTNQEIVDIGSTVTIKNEGQTKTYMIVGTYEANPGEGKISSSSPLGKALLGKKAGEEILFSVQNSQTVYTITSVI